MNGDASVGSQEAVKEDIPSMAYGEVMEKYEPKWYDRSEGWSGKTYEDGECTIVYWFKIQFIN